MVTEQILMFCKKIILFFMLLFYIFSALVQIVRADPTLIFGILFFLTGFNMAIIFPFLFNFIIEPKIEKKLGKKLEYPFMQYDTLAFGKFIYRHLFIVIFIVRKYWNLKGGLSRNPLFKAGYDINLASRFEIIVCFAAFINFLTCIICAIWMMIYLKPAG